MAAGCDSSGGNGDGGAGGDGGIWPALACPWGKDFPTLTLPMGEVQGILKGQSRNSSTTCTRQKGTGGPETVYLLPVKTRTTVELEVVSTIDTVLAIRTACDDPLTELACNDNPAGSGTGGAAGAGGGPIMEPPPPPFGPADAGVSGDPIPGGGRDAHLRATLNPGTYYVLVDEAEPFGVGGAFTLKLSSAAPVAHASCSAAKPLTDGLRLAGEELDVALEKPPSCSGAEARPALFYSARVPSGQRLTVRAVATGGDGPWNPVMTLLSGCGNGRCLARDGTTLFGDRQLRYVNNGPQAEDVILAVSASTAVSGATYQLTVSLGEPVLNGTCAAARPLSDGLVLRNQDLSEGQVTQSAACVPSGGQALFYAVDLLPQQPLAVTLSSRDQVDPRFGFPGKTPLFMALLTGCNQLECRPGTNGTDRLDYINTTNAVQKLILVVTSLPGLPSVVFDMMVSMPLPPGSVYVTPTNGLVTTESGGTASFEVVLGSPPMRPVMIPLESSLPGEGTVSPASLTFGPDSWDRPQKVIVTGVDDSVRDGNRPYTIRVKPAVSVDPRYQGLDGDDVSVSNRDNEASFTFVGGSPLTTSEAGTTVTFSAVLNRRPIVEVTLPLTTSDPGEGTVSPASLTFTPANWDIPQYVTVTGVDDKDEDGNQPYKIVTGTVTTTDPDYSGLDPEDLDAVNADNEFTLIPAHAVSGSLPCFGGGFGRQISADEAGTLYVVMACQQSGGAGAPGTRGGSGGGSGSSSGSGGSAGSGAAPGSAADAGVAPAPVPAADAGRAPSIPPMPLVPGGMVVVSTDGGATFTAPRWLGISQTGDVQVAGGPPGVAYVVGQSGSGLTFVRTADSGATWSAPRTLAGDGGGARIAAAGQRVVITGSGPQGALLWHSEDGGAHFTEARLGIFGSVMGLQVQADGGVSLYVQEMLARILRSTDGGATFPTSIDLPSGSFFDSIDFGSQSIFGSSKETRLMVMPLSNPMAPRFVEGLTSSPRGPRTLVVDDRSDTVTVLDPDFTGLQARRLEAGATSFSAAKSLGGFDSAASGVALSDKAVAVAMWQGGQVLVTVQVWD